MSSSSSSVCVSLHLLVTAMLAVGPRTSTSAPASNCPFVTGLSPQPFRGCWTQTSDVHGYGGVPHDFTTIDECQSACFNNNACVAVDWDPSNAGKNCWIHSSIVIGPTMETGFVTHSELNRAFLKCWMQRNGFRAYDGVSHNATTLDECQAACANDNTCAAIDWEPSSVGESCRISTSTDARETVSVAHYELKRICLRSPADSNVWPLYGPEAGGTLVTVTGSELTDSQQPMIFFVSPNLDHFVSLSTIAAEQMSVVMGKTAASNETGEQLLVVVQDVDKPPVNTTKFFVYRQTPYIIDIFPLSHLLSGSTVVTVSGNNINVAVQPIIAVTVVVTRFNLTNDDNVTMETTVTREATERCTVRNSSLMTCLMPEVPLPSELQDNDVVYSQTSVTPEGNVTSPRGGSDNDDVARVYVSLIYDGNKIPVPSQNIRFYAQPTFDASTSLITYRPESGSNIDVTGSNLQRGCRISDYRVVIGNGECALSSLSDNLLTCRPPYDEPKLSYDDPFCDDDNSVRVYLGNIEHLYACLRYEPEDVSILWIILIIIFLVFWICVLIIVVILKCTRRCRSKRTTDNDDFEFMTVVPRRPSHDNPSPIFNPVFSPAKESSASAIDEPPPSQNVDVSEEPTTDWMSLYLQILTTAGVKVDAR